MYIFCLFNELCCHSIDKCDFYWEVKSARLLTKPINDRCCRSEFICFHSGKLSDFHQEQKNLRICLDQKNQKTGQRAAMPWTSCRGSPERTLNVRYGDGLQEGRGSLLLRALLITRETNMILLWGYGPAGISYWSELWTIFTVQRLLKKKTSLDLKVCWTHKNRKEAVWGGGANHWLARGVIICNYNNIYNSILI